MKVYAICASPRKGWNCDQLLTKFKEGVKSKLPECDIETVYLYDLDYKGCRSCFGCRLLTNKEGRCVVRDDIYELLNDIRHCNGFGYASPIYFSDMTGQMKAFLERLEYPGPTEKEIPIEAIYTMNANEEKLNNNILPTLLKDEKSLAHNFKTTINATYAYTTWQRDHNELYKPSSHSNLEQKTKYREEHWPIDLQNAFNAGVRLAERISNNEKESD